PGWRDPGTAGCPSGDLAERIHPALAFQAHARLRDHVEAVQRDLRAAALTPAVTAGVHPDERGLRVVQGMARGGDQRGHDFAARRVGGLVAAVAIPAVDAVGLCCELRELHEPEPALLLEHLAQKREARLEVR